MTGRFEGKVALVTGAGSGLGRASAQRLSAEGASVVLIDVNGDAVDAVAADLSGDALVVVADVSDEAAVDGAVARAVDRFLARAERPALEPAPRPLGLRLSARNQLRAEVRAVRHGAVMSSVEALLPDGQRLTASITREAAVDLDLAPGDDVLLIITSTEVMVATLTPCFQNR